MSSFIYKTADKPRFVRGHAVTFAMVGFACVVFGVMVRFFFHSFISYFLFLHPFSALPELEEVESLEPIFRIPGESVLT